MKQLRITLLILIPAIIITFFIFAAFNDPQQFVLSLIETYENNAAWMLLLLFLLIVLSTIGGLPVLYFGVAIGFLFPYLPALGLTILFNLLAVMISFYLVRRVFFGYFKIKYGDKKIIKSINKRIKKYGLWTVAISRSIYVIPTNIINFSFPLSKIHSSTYFWGTLIGLVPETLINVTTGYLIKHQVLLLNDPQANALKIAIIGVSLILMGLAFLYIRYRKKRRTKIKNIVPLLDE